MNRHQRQRLEELLATRATQALTAAESDELKRLAIASPGTDTDDFDRAAGALHLAFAAREHTTSMPEEVRRRLKQRAAHWTLRPRHDF